MDEIDKLVSLRVNLPPEQSLLLPYPWSQKQDPSGTQTGKTNNTFNENLVAEDKGAAEYISVLAITLLGNRLMQNFR